VAAGDDLSFHVKRLPLIGRWGNYGGADWAVAAGHEEVAGGLRSGALVPALGLPGAISTPGRRTSSAQ